MYLQEVKKLLFFILALQIISAGQFLTEAVKFQDLAVHFFEHKQGEQPLGLLEFFKLHYFDTQHEGSDPIRHASLPLYQTTAHFATVFHHNPETMTLTPFDAEPTIEFNSISKGLMPQCHQVAVFQPPRAA
jgi:hypothetical protein